MEPMSSSLKSLIPSKNSALLLKKYCSYIFKLKSKLDYKDKEKSYIFDKNMMYESYFIASNYWSYL